MSLEVQSDGLANVVRIIDEDGSHELDPDRAEEFGEEVIRAARDVATEQATLGETPEEGQATLDDTDEEGAFDYLLDRERDWELGEPLNANDPMKW